MAGTFTTDLTIVRTFETFVSGTDYTSVGTFKSAPAQNDDYRIESTNSVVMAVSSGSGVGTCSFLGITTAANQNWSGAHFYMWIKGVAWPSNANQAKGGVRIAISSDLAPTAIRSLLAATVTAGGSGYTLNDVLTLSGGTGTAAQVKVTGVSGGAVTSVEPVRTARGAYTALPTNPISTTGGTGTGCTLNAAGTGNPPDGWIYTITNAKSWFVGGADTVIVDGWVCYVTEVDGTCDLDTGGTMSSVDTAGLTATMISTSKVTTHIADVCRYLPSASYGIKVNDGTSGDPVTFEAMRAYDNANARAWGVVTVQQGIFFLAGPIRVGSSSQTAITYFKDTNQVCVWLPFPVNASFYGITLAGAGSFATTFQLGNYSGGVASGGVTIRCALRYTHYAGVSTGYVTAIWTLTADAANTVCKLYGCTLLQMKSAALRSDSEMRFCTVQDSGTITPGGATIDSCTFLDLRTTAPISATYQIDVATSAPILTNCGFINCATAVRWNVNADTNGKLDGSKFTSGGTGHAIEFGANTPGDPTEITFTNVIFTGYGGTPGSNQTPSSGSTDAAVYNNSGKAITINIVGGTTPAVRNGAGATTTVNVSYSYELTNLVVGSEVRIFNASTGAELAGTESCSATFSYSHSGATVSIYVIIQKTDYEWLRINDTLASANKSTKVLQRLDRNYANP